MWVFPLVAAVVAFVFAGALFRQFATRRRSYQLLWAISLVMYGVASVAVVVGVLSGWDPFWFGVYWALGAVLNVPFLAGGEVQLARPQPHGGCDRRPRACSSSSGTPSPFFAERCTDASALADRLPSGKDVFGDGTAAHRLPQLISIPSFTVLLLGTLWSAWKMRGRPELRDRFYGTLFIALGASDRRRGCDVRGVRQPARVLHHAGGRHLGDVRRVPARLTPGDRTGSRAGTRSLNVPRIGCRPPRNVLVG